MMTYEVRKIPDYPMYTISNTGIVFSLKIGKELRCVNNHAGYKCVGLTNEHGRKQLKVHRLVMQTFFPVNGMEYMQVNHKDGNKQNNRIDNLEWCLPLDNTRHAIKTGLKPKMDQRGAKNYNSKLDWQAVKYIREHYNKETCNCAVLAKRFGVHQTTIKFVVDNKTWKDSDI